MSVICAQALGAEKFNSGPVFADYGLHAKVDVNKPLLSNQKFMVAFDLAKSADNTKLNRRIDSLARFINMHVANGVKLDNISLALVVHGKASADLLSNSAFKGRNGHDNPNSQLLKLLMDNGVEIFLCGQSAAYYGISREELISGVNMSLSAMTAHALLAQKGYSLNPF